MRAALALPLAVLVGACTVDTELGVAATVRGGAVTITSDDVVQVEARTEFRVGEHADGTRQFVLGRLELFVEDTPAAQVNPDYPPGFDGQLSPGEEQAVTLTGATTPGAFPSAREVLCGASTVRILVRWQDVTPGDTPVDSEFGVAEGTTGDVTCE